MLQNKTILFIHQNFPGQFLHLSRSLAQNNRVLFITRKTPNRIGGVQLLVYDLSRKPTPNIHSYLARSEEGILHGQAVARVLLELQKKGVRPDVIVGHSGWGETQFVKDVFPDVPLLSYFEFYYHATGADVGFDPHYPSSPETRFTLGVRNQLLLGCLQSTDRGLSPTWWQQGLFPEQYRSKISVIHEGVDTQTHSPELPRGVTFRDGLSFDGTTPLVTFVARNLEPYRGFHIFMQAVRLVLESHPTVQFAVVGGDEVSYGSKLPEGETYRSQVLKATPVDESRVHFLGRIDYEIFKAMLRTSAAHVYLTYPFVLSWSMIEALSTGCLIIGSRTAPVEEVIRHEQNGLLVDFFDHEKIAAAILQSIEQPESYRDMRIAARRTAIERYDLHAVSLPRQKALIAEMLR